MLRKANPYLFMSKALICMVYMYDCLFWEGSKSYIDKFVKSFKEYGTSYNWEHLKGDSVYEFLGIDVKTLNDG